MAAATAGQNCSSQGGALAPVGSFDECKAAVSLVKGSTSAYPKAQSKKHFPKGCSRCNDGCSTWDRGVLFFNTRTGSDNPNHELVCRVVVPASAR